MNTFTNTFAGLLTGTVIAFGIATPSQAQNAHYLAQDASQCEIFRGLSRDLPAECGTVAAKPAYQTLRSFGRTRGLVVYGETQPVRVAEATAVAPAKAVKKDLSIAFRAEFAFDSAELTPEAKEIVDRVAAVLKDKLMRNKVIEIDGHADARGDDAYNMKLSEVRAEAVTQYLVTRHNIDPSRLKFVGKGESQPYDASHPEASINRRVEFRNITG
jgi:outer membrane protein OmpA-like peptidoglycan-associated protein